jgi:peptidoglycan/LPS O-acetylase OafA/YrhL
MVLVFHTQTGLLPGGFIGVDVFFVLSGYLITNNLMREVETTGSINLAAFYAQRLKRLLPMSSLLLVVITLSGRWMLEKETWPFLTHDIQAAALYYANVRFGQRVSNYFDPEAANSPVMHYWSLSVEEQFSFLWPLIITILTMGTKYIAARWNKHINLRDTALPVIAAGLLCSLLYSVWKTSTISSSTSTTGSSLISTSTSTSYFQTSQRAWELLVGCFLSITHSESNQTPQPHSPSLRALTYIAMVSLLGFTCLYNSDTVFPGTAAIGPVICTAVILHAGQHGNDTYIHTFLSSAPLVFVGNISYSIYMWHWPLLQYAVRVAAVHTIGELPSSWLLATLICTLLASILTHIWVETPVRRMKASSPVVIAVATACSFLVAAIPAVILYNQDTAVLLTRMNVDKALNEHAHVDLDFFPIAA